MSISNKEAVSHDCPKDANKQLSTSSKGQTGKFPVDKGDYISVRDPKLLLPGECYIEMHQDGSYEILDIKREIDNSDCEKKFSYMKPALVSNKTKGKGSKKLSKKQIENRISEQSAKYFDDKSSYITVRDPKLLLPGECYINFHQDGSYDILDIIRETENLNGEEEFSQQKPVQSSAESTNSEKIKGKTRCVEEEEANKIASSENHDTKNIEDGTENNSLSKKNEELENTSEKKNPGKNRNHNKDRTSIGQKQEQKLQSEETKKKRGRPKKAGTNGVNINNNEPRKNMQSKPLKRKSENCPTANPKRVKTPERPDSHNEEKETSNDKKSMTQPKSTSLDRAFRKRRTLYSPTAFEHSPDFTLVFGDYTKD